MCVLLFRCSAWVVRPLNTSSGNCEGYSCVHDPEYPRAALLRLVSSQSASYQDVNIVNCLARIYEVVLGQLQRARWRLASCIGVTPDTAAYVMRLRNYATGKRLTKGNNIIYVNADCDDVCAGPRPTPGRCLRSLTIQQRPRQCIQATMLRTADLRDDGDARIQSGSWERCILGYIIRVRVQSLSS